MAGEIAFAATPLVPLCRRAGEGRCAPVRAFFDALALESSCPEASAEGRTRRLCAEAGLCLPASARTPLERLFDGFGRSDREGQLSQLRLAQRELTLLADELSEQLEGRCRSCALLGLSAGAAVLILVI